jgi:hypothetical protein
VSSGVGSSTPDASTIDRAAECAVHGNIFIQWHAAYGDVAPEYVVRDPNASVYITFRVNGLPATISIDGFRTANEFSVEFSTYPLGQPLLPGEYEVTSLPGDGPGPEMSAGANGMGGPTTGSFRVVEMNAAPVFGNSVPDGPAGLTSFTAAFEVPSRGVGGCVHVEPAQ